MLSPNKSHADECCHKTACAYRALLTDPFGENREVVDRRKHGCVNAPITIRWKSFLQCHIFSETPLSQIGDFESCANDCTEALDLQKVYPKVTLRRAAAYEKLERFEDALADYKAVLQQDPSNATAREAVVVRRRTSGVHNFGSVSLFTVVTYIAGGGFLLKGTFHNERQ